MAISLNINDLSTKINNAVTGNTGGDNEALAGAINKALTDWFKTNLFPLMVGVAVFITVLFVFYGSFLYFTAYGDENRATQAKKTITYAFVGFFIVAMSLGIANYTKRIIVSKEYETGTTGGAAVGTQGKERIPTGGGGTLGETDPTRPNP